ncbi:unnamed protein product, partial [Adineta ricciae]
MPRHLRSCAGADGRPRPLPQPGRGRPYIHTRKIYLIMERPLTQHITFPPLGLR